MRDTIDMALEAGATKLVFITNKNGPATALRFDLKNESLKRFADLVRADERTRLEHNNTVLMNALWKACGDDEQVVNATIESQGELK